MRNQFHARKRTSVALGMLLALAVAGGAFAYWTISGSGTGTATAGTVTNNLTVTQLSAVTGLYPGGAPQALSVRISNPNSSPVKVGQLSAAVSSSGLPTGCTTDDFAVGGAVNLGAMIGANDYLDNSGLSVWMVETGVAQNACQGADVALDFSVSVP